MCPLSTNKSALCNAALSALMIKPSCCLNGEYKRCAIYAIASQRCEMERQIRQEDDSSMYLARDIKN